MAFVTYIGICILSFIGICILEYWLYTNFIGDPFWWVYCLGVIISYFIVNKLIAPIVEKVI